MRRLVLVVPWVLLACGKPVSLSGGDEAPPATGTTELRLAVPEPLRLEFEPGWQWGTPLRVGLALGAGAATTVRVRPPRAMPNFADLFGPFAPVRWDEVSVVGENVNVTLEPEEQVLRLEALGEGDFTVTLLGEYVTSSAARKPTRRPIWVQLGGAVRAAHGWQIDASCFARDEVVVTPGASFAPRISAVDAAGAPFDALNHPALTLKADAPIVLPVRFGTLSFVGAGEVSLGLETTAPVVGLRKVRVAAPTDLSALKLSGSLIDDEPTIEVRSGTVVELGRVVVREGAQPYWLPRLRSTTSHGLELCAPPTPSSFELESLTPEVCTPERLGGEVVVGAHLLRSGHCSLRLHVLGNARLTTGFEFDVQLP